MKFSAQEEYGLRCLLEIARVGADGSITIPEISRREGLTEPYVAKLLMLLRKEGFIRSTRGQSGGYALASPAGSIVVGHVLSALGGKLYEKDFCDKHTGQQQTCTHAEGCSIRSLWSRVQDAVDSVVQHVTLEQILKEEAIAGYVQLQESPRRSTNTPAL